MGSGELVLEGYFLATAQSRNALISLLAASCLTGATWLFYWNWLIKGECVLCFGLLPGSLRLSVPAAIYMYHNSFQDSVIQELM